MSHPHYVDIPEDEVDPRDIKEVTSLWHAPSRTDEEKIFVGFTVILHRKDDTDPMKACGVTVDNTPEAIANACNIVEHKRREIVSAFQAAATLQKSVKLNI